MWLLARPYLIWIVAPLVFVLGIAAGINSATAEASPTPPPVHVPGEASAPRPEAVALIGTVVQIDLRTQLAVVQNKAGKLIIVSFKGNPVIKSGGTRVRPRDIYVGDRVVVAGKRIQPPIVDARVITVTPNPATHGSAPPNTK